MQIKQVTRYAVETGASPFPDREFEHEHEAEQYIQACEIAKTIFDEGCGTMDEAIDAAQEILRKYNVVKKDA